MKQQAGGVVSKRKIPGLDGLRGIAIIGVVGYHLVPNIFPGGFLGVNLFFVLSGYLMAVTSRKAQKHAGFRLSAFYIKRAARIYPALIVCVCATLCAAQLLTPDIIRGIRREVLSILSGGNNWWQIAQNASYFTKITGTSPFTHLWSLAIEMQFYLIWPVLFLLYAVLKHYTDKASLLWMLLIGASVLSLFLRFQPGEDPSRVYYGTDTRIFALLIGARLGLSRKSLSQYLGNKSLLCGTVFLSLLIVQFILFFLANGESPLTYWLLLIPSAEIGAALIDLCRDKRFAFGQILDCLPFSWIGKRSYELYLVQYPIIFFVQRTQPIHSQAWNHVLALLLILFVGNWMYWVTARIQIQIRKRKGGIYEKPSTQNRRTDFLYIDYCDSDRRYIRLDKRSRAANE